MIPFKLRDTVIYNGPDLNFKGKHGVIIAIDLNEGAWWPIRVRFTDGTVKWCHCESLKLKSLNYPNLF